MVIKKLFDGVYELFSGFFELGALVFCVSLIFWVSGLFLGLAVCSVSLLQAVLPARLPCPGVSGVHPPVTQPQLPR